MKMNAHSKLCGDVHFDPCLGGSFHIRVPVLQTRGFTQYTDKYINAFEVLCTYATINGFHP